VVNAVFDITTDTLDMLGCIVGYAAEQTHNNGSFFILNLINLLDINLYKFTAIYSPVFLFGEKIKRAV